MKNCYVKNKFVGSFDCLRDAAVAYFKTQAVMPMGEDVWVSVMTGELIVVEVRIEDEDANVASSMSTEGAVAC